MSVEPPRPPTTEAEKALAAYQGMKRMAIGLLVIVLGFVGLMLLMFPPSGDLFWEDKVVYGDTN